MFREFKIGTTSVGKKPKSYLITDAKDNSEIDIRPKAAEFPISQAFDQDLQYRRARDYCNYLNKLVEATKQAYEQNQLINVLKS